MARIRFLFVPCLLLGLSACASLTSPARVHELKPGQNNWLDYDATRRGTVVTGGSATRSCAEPSPDMALELVADIQANMDYQGVDAAAQGSVATTAVKLAERSQMLLFFREALYRVCEISLNTDLSDEQIVKLYEQIVRTALLLGSDKAIEADVEKLKLDLTAKAQEIQDKQLQIEQARMARESARLAELEAELKLLRQDQASLALQARAVSAQKQVEANQVAQVLQDAGNLPAANDDSAAAPDGTPGGR
jgi:hypothetical protein